MWTCTALLVCLAALAGARTLPEEGERFFQATKEYLTMQKQILQFFQNPHNPEFYKSFGDYANYRLEENADKYEDSANVKRFVKYVRTGNFFPKDQIYNLFSEHGNFELEAMYDLFRYAKDFETFIKTAVYLLENFNEGITYYAFATALEAREDTRDFYIPPTYEIYPYLYVDEKVIQKAQYAKVRGLQSGGNHEKKYYFYYNYTGHYDYTSDPETSLYYFTEDVGLNALNVEFTRRFPAWFNSTKYHEYHDRRGEIFLNYQRQLLARFNLERLSNNLGEVPYITRDSLLPGYYPHLRYSNGQSVTPRQPYTPIRDTEEIGIKDIEYYINNLWRAIDTGFFYDVNGTKISLDYPHGLNALGELVYFFGDNANENLYGPYIKELIHHISHLTDQWDEHDLPPSSLMRPDTALRDPIYYSIIFKFFEDVYYRYIEKVPKYTRDELIFPGVNIEDVDVTDLITYFDYFDFDLRNAYFGSYEKEEDFEIYARKQRLNHRHFSYKVSVNSDKDIDAVVKVYITPKYDSYGRPLSRNRRNFYAFEIDRNIVKIPSGKSTIERKCEDFTVASKEPTTFHEMWHKVEAAFQDKEPLKVDRFDRPYGFPQHLLLPKGHEQGLPVEFLVVVYPYEQADTTDRRTYTMPSFPLLGASYNVKFPDPRPVSYPLDKLVRSEYDFHVPNFFSKEVRIFHKNLDEINQVPDAHHH